MSEGNCIIITKARNGTVSITRGLTREEAKAIQERLWWAPMRALQSLCQANGGSIVTYPEPGELVSCEIISLASPK